MTLRCSYCGVVIPAEEWHPVETVRDEHGDVEIYDFCDETCREAWMDEFEERKDHNA